MTGWNLHLLHTSDKRPTEAVGALRNTELSGTHVLPRMFVPLHLPKAKVRPFPFISNASYTKSHSCKACRRKKFGSVSRMSYIRRQKTSSMSIANCTCGYEDRPPSMTDSLLHTVRTVGKGTNLFHFIWNAVWGIARPHVQYAESVVVVQIYLKWWYL
jgi:hypothetical protein